MADPKQKPMSQESIHIIYGILFVLLALGALVALVMMRSFTDTSSQSSGVTNSLPTLTTVKVDSVTDQTGTWDSEDTDGVTFVNESSANTIYIHGTATDNNGCVELKKLAGATGAAWTVAVYRTNVTNGSTCTAANNDCYQYSTAAAAEPLMTEDTCIEDGTDLTQQFEFAIPLLYYADPTDSSAPTHSATTWTASVGLTDSQGGVATAGTDVFEINTFNALNVSPTIDFSDDGGSSSLALGFSPANGQETVMTITNTGNNTIDVQVSGTALDCAAGYADIAVGNSKYFPTAATAYASMTALTGTPATADVNVAKSSNGAAATGSLYWKLAIPSTGVGGTCSSNVTVSATDHDGT